MKYTREDVIIWADDPRLEGAIGKKCYIGKRPSIALKDANDGNFEMTLKKLHFNNGFADGEYAFTVSNSVYDFTTPFIVLKKEPKKKIIPFDPSLEEDRKIVKGLWIRERDTNTEVQIIGIDNNRVYTVTSSIGMEALRMAYVFADGDKEGNPVGTEVEE